jgi:hypothetical protein
VPEPRPGLDAGPPDDLPYLRPQVLTAPLSLTIRVPAVLLGDDELVPILGVLEEAFSEAACLMLRSSPRAKAWIERQEKKRGKRKALAVLEAKLGRTVYHLWKKRVPFDARRFLAA